MTTTSFSQKKYTTGVLVSGGGTGGIAAAIQCARLGIPTLVVEPTAWLGGMLTAAGVSCVDGNHALSSGIWREFRRGLYQHYGTKDLATGWVSETCFEPHVGDSLFKAMAAREKKLTVMYGWNFESVLQKGNKVTGAIFTNKRGERLTVQAEITIDATELGDVFAAAGAQYDLGTEDAGYSGEKMAPGKTDIIQDLTWAAVLRLKEDSQVIAKPANYDARGYYCCCSSAPCEGKSYPADAAKMLSYAKLPNNKYMINWPAHGNDYYANVAEADDLTRSHQYELARQHTLGFIYFIQTVLGYKRMGLAADEMDSGLAFIPYNREGRRLKGMVRFTINELLDPYNNRKQLYRTGVAVGDYPVDHHHGQNEHTPPIKFPPIPSFNIPLGALIPETKDGLIVCEKGISVSNIVNGTTRLQPVVLLTGQAAGVLAALSVSHHRQPRIINIREMQQKLLGAGCFLMPFIDVLPTDPHWQAIQRIGVTGILRGVGKAEGWANKMFFYPGSPVNKAAFAEDAKAFGFRDHSQKGNVLTVHEALQFAAQFNRSSNQIKQQPSEKQKKLWQELGLDRFDPSRPITRKELAVLLDHEGRLFEKKQVNLEGKFY